MALLGIDLGTTFSAMASLDPNGVPMTIPNAEGELTTPSVVLFEPNGEVIVGREARRAALAEPSRVAEDVKRHMGDADFPKLLNGKRLTPVGISSLILDKLRRDAVKRIGRIEGVVITVPAYFDEARRQATAAAGRLAGLKVIDIVNEPMAAALAYAYRGLSAQDQKNLRGFDGPPRTVLVYDLGGGTFDVTVMRIAGSDLKVLATAGDVQLGGRDWDERLFIHMADQFLHANGEDPRDDPISRQALMMTAEETKKTLSARAQATFTVSHAGKTLRGEISREQFDQLTADLLFRTENRVGRVLKQAQLSWSQIDEVLATGGSVRMPQVVEMLQRASGKLPNLSLSPDEAVAHGAAIHAAVCAVSKKELPKDSVADTRSEPVTDPDGESPGFLSQLKGRVLDLLRSIRTTNVNAHSLGVVARLAGDEERVSVLIPHDTQLPVSVTKRFGTVSDNQKTVTVCVVEGESPDPAECMVVGSCQIRQLTPNLPKGSPIEVTFAYDNSGRLNVKAIEVKSGNWAEATIHRRSGIAQATLEYDPSDKAASGPAR